MFADPDVAVNFYLFRNFLSKLVFFLWEPPTSKLLNSDLFIGLLFSLEHASKTTKSLDMVLE